MRVLFTVSDENFSELKATWRKYSRQSRDEGAIGTPIADHVRGGGLLLELDFRAKRLVRNVPLPMATGIEATDDGLAVAAQNKVYLLDDELNVLKSTSHPWFNNLHSITRVDEQFVVTSSGLDVLLWLNNDLEVNSYWSAIDHGFVHDTYGQQRHVDLNQDHSQRVYPTLVHTTHLNSAAWDGRNSTLYLTLFHQGLVLALSQRGEFRIELDKLGAPHSVQLIDGNQLLVVDSVKNEWVIWPIGDGRAAQRVQVPTDWLQDVRPIPGNPGELLAADSGNARILRVSASGTVHDEFVYDPEWRIHQLLLLP